jgi:predicted nucleic acid-binding protein
MSGLAYLDASAFVKLLVHEPETPALQASLLGQRGLVASRLTLLETQRAVRRRPGAALIATLEDLTNATVLVEIDASTIERAAAIDPPLLRSLDAIHLASALAVGDPSLHVITYDDRLADAARANGLTVVQPGRETQG